MATRRGLGLVALTAASVVAGARASRRWNPSGGPPRDDGIGPPRAVSTGAWGIADPQALPQPHEQLQRFFQRLFNPQAVLDAPAAPVRAPAAVSAPATPAPPRAKRASAVEARPTIVLEGAERPAAAAGVRPTVVLERAPAAAAGARPTVVLERAEVTPEVDGAPWVYNKVRAEVPDVSTPAEATHMAMQIRHLLVEARRPVALDWSRRIRYLSKSYASYESLTSYPFFPETFQNQHTFWSSTATALIDIIAGSGDVAEYLPIHMSEDEALDQAFLPFSIATDQQEDIAPPSGSAGLSEASGSVRWEASVARSDLDDKSVAIFASLAAPRVRAAAAVMLVHLSDLLDEATRLDAVVQLQALDEQALIHSDVGHLGAFLPHEAVEMGHKTLLALNTNPLTLRTPDSFRRLCEQTEDAMEWGPPLSLRQHLVFRLLDDLHYRPTDERSLQCLTRMVRGDSSAQFMSMWWRKRETTLSRQLLSALEDGHEFQPEEKRRWRELLTEMRKLAALGYDRI